MSRHSQQPWLHILTKPCTTCGYPRAAPFLEVQMKFIRHDTAWKVDVLALAEASSNPLC
jgi:hypothetical protein